MRPAPRRSSTEVSYSLTRTLPTRCSSRDVRCAAPGRIPAVAYGEHPGSASRRCRPAYTDGSGRRGWSGPRPNDAVHTGSSWFYVAHGSIQFGTSWTAQLRWSHDGQQGGPILVARTARARGSMLRGRRHRARSHSRRPFLGAAGFRRAVVPIRPGAASRPPDGIVGHRCLWMFSASSPAARACAASGQSCSTRSGGPILS